MKNNFRGRNCQAEPPCGEMAEEITGIILVDRSYLVKKMSFFYRAPTFSSGALVSTAERLMSTSFSDTV